MRIISAVFSVILPGGGAFLRKRYFLAAAELALFLALVQVYILVEIIRPTGIPARLGAAVLTGAIAIAAVNAAFEIIRLARNNHLRAANSLETLYSQALAAYISMEDAKAEEILRRALRLDGLNVDVLFLRAQVAARLGNARHARRLFRKCRNFDEKGKWGWETQVALEHL